jgi:hypothetical protein
MTLIRVPAKRLAVGDRFIPDRFIPDNAKDDEGCLFTVLEHTFTGRGDYSTIVQSDDTDWTERFAPDEWVWLET